MKVLVINAWSSSLKYQVFNMPQKETLAKWLIEKIGLDMSIVNYKAKWEKTVYEKPIKNHKEALNEAFKLLTEWETAIMNSIWEIEAVWHRVVHGWESFSDSVIINDTILKEIQACVEIAPLHNPANIEWIMACKALMNENVPQIAVFDTAFHQTMKPEVFLYAIPYEYYTKYKIRRYGFHGTSHKYVSTRAAEILWVDIHDHKMITCHIGSGASITAVKNGKSIDTTTGFTPVAWLVMGTRCGDLDPAIPNYIAKKEKLTWDEVETILNKKSGLLGLSCQSSDMRDIETWDAQCQLALDVYVNRIVKYIWAYTAEMWWVDSIIFTAWVGENWPIIRKKICEKLAYMWITLDEEKNAIRWEEVMISKDDSKVKVLVVPTEEELMIATDTYNLVSAVN